MILTDMGLEADTVHGTVMDMGPRTALDMDIIRGVQLHMHMLDPDIQTTIILPELLLRIAMPEMYCRSEK